MALTRSIDPLVWLDCEMTGLDPRTDTILSISVLLTNSTLVPIEPEGLTLYIYHTPEQLSHMSPWCVSTHTSSGLTRLVSDPNSSTSAAVASRAILDYITYHIPEPRTALLAGNSIHADKAFLMIPPWNCILEHLHYRLFDVSAMKEMVRRWASDEVLAQMPPKKLAHQAREDVLESIDEARFYMRLLSGLGSSTTGENSANVGANGNEFDTAKTKTKVAHDQSNANSHSQNSTAPPSLDSHGSIIQASPLSQKSATVVKTSHTIQALNQMPAHQTVLPAASSTRAPIPALFTPDAPRPAPPPYLLPDGGTTGDVAMAAYGRHGEIEAEIEKDRFRTDVP
ncbi:hypothetical protein PV10_02579 [Exophiala mesophila]|uniref:Exonuclease domain-containing protein n=1 Tax=Exophiala mesophila TaxID=212818 RepID=A0A0D1WZA2_EXOME|nr:uncharacterized protein PV10_02579 [Exophiala mesophila]KIV94855.1 hypothetical protein PV10_02579 [Exophiala mesophila]